VQHRRIKPIRPDLHDLDVDASVAEADPVARLDPRERSS
jgi:hypothetical protein